MKNIVSIRNSEENKSITLKISPPNTKRPLTNNRAEQNKRKEVKTFKPKVIIKNAIAAARSMLPRIFTKTIQNPLNKGLNTFVQKPQNGFRKGFW